MKTNRILGKIKILGKRLKWLIKLLILLVSCLGLLLYIDFIHMNSDLAICLLMIYTYLYVSTLVYSKSEDDVDNEAIPDYRKIYSRKLVEKILIEGKPTEITLRNTRKDAYQYFFSCLSEDGAKFYAILENNMISIYIRLNDSKKEYLLDTITKEEFSTYCFY